MEANIYSWSSALTSGDAWDTRFPIVLVISEDFTKVTHGEIIDFIRWDLTFLCSGLCPTIGFYNENLDGNYVAAASANEVLAGPWRGQFAGNKGDLKAKVESNGFERNAQANFICEQCGACRHLDTYNWANYTLGAGWRKVRVTTDFYIRSSGRFATHWSLQPGWDLTRNLWDLMHIGPLGIMRDLGGSVICELLEYGHIPLVVDKAKDLIDPDADVPNLM